jgi:hypothetical protein
LVTHVISVDNFPSLGCIAIIATNPNWLSFFILVVLNHNQFTISDIDKVFTLVLEHLPPVGAGAVVLHVVGFT